MKLTIVYSNEALTDFEAILSYYLSSYAYTIAENIEQGILAHIELLSTNPTIGHKDLFFESKRLSGFRFSKLQTFL
ncbi:MAG: type II toxin-antitoxin system RelE/ParE family toxin [Bacteroidia bacterium]|jgi:plasmid stabilization system protein ParE|nr:type II toxin-antitoxin system RelE/ParE family toxin [Bacteroidia bacterium]